jgi:oxygen-independent coproporphyrinogen-3 oxidase
MKDFLKDNGFDHYEISNFGKPGFHSKHNSAYWKSEPYLGIGPSAHSYNGIWKEAGILPIIQSISKI